MTCTVCRHENTEAGVTTVTLQRGAATIIVRDVPATVCPECGEAWVDEAVAAELLKVAEDAVQRGVEVDICRYSPPAMAA